MDRTSLALSLVIFAACVAGCSSGPGDGPPAESCQYVEEGEDWPGPEGTVDVAAEKVVDNLEVPWGIAFIDADNFLVTERDGRLRLVEDGELVEEPVADLTGEVGGGEGGLLDIQPHPDFPDNETFYLYYTDNSARPPVNRVERWTYDAETRTASSESVIIDDIPANSYHVGGRLDIGPDGNLYIGTGDAGDPSNAQDETVPAGSLLRVGLDGSIPEDNPFGDDTPAYIIGLRNSQGFDWLDEETMVVVDHGPSATAGEMGRADHDEVNLAEAGDNLGWPEIYRCQTAEGMRAPLITWEESVPPGGAAVYRGDAIEEWQGDVLVGSLRAQHLHRLEIDTEEEVVTKHDVYFYGGPSGGLGRLRDVTMGPDGHVYVTTSNCDGRGTCPDERDAIYRIVPE